MARLHELLDAHTIAGKPIANGRQAADLVAEVIVREALKGKPKFVEMLLERVYGKAPQKIEAEVKATYHDADVDAILRAYGYVPRGDAPVTSEAQPGRPGDGPIEGQMDTPESSPASRLEPGGCRGGTVSPTPDHGSAPAWQE
jgi:hypothetical protein